MNVIIIGKPGAGKGTICKKLVENFNYRLISTGDLLRKEMESFSPLGVKISSMIERGDLVPDDLVNSIVVDEISKPIKLDQFYLMDGYPRTESQAFRLDEMLNIPFVIWLNISDETTISRNLERGKTSGRADDLNVDVIKKRLDRYNESTVKIKEFYENRIVEVDGEGTPDEVYQRIINILFDTYTELREIEDII